RTGGRPRPTPSPTSGRRSGQADRGQGRSQTPALSTRSQPITRSRAAETHMARLVLFLVPAIRLPWELPRLGESDGTDLKRHDQCASRLVRAVRPGVVERAIGVDGGSAGREWARDRSADLAVVGELQAFGCLV